MKLIKWVLISFLSLMLLAVSLIFILITYYKKEMAELLEQRLKDQYGLELKVEKLSVSFFDNWPHAALALKGVTLRSELYKNANHPLLHADVLSLSLDLKKLMQKQFVIRNLALKDAEVTLIRDFEGRQNFEFRKQNDSLRLIIESKDVQDKVISFEIQHVSIKRTRLLFRNFQRDQLIHIDFDAVDLHAKNFSDGITAQLAGEVHVGQLMFKRHKGAFLRDTKAKLELNLILNKNEKTLCVAPGSVVEIDKEKYSVVTLLQMGEKKRLSMIMQSDVAKLEKVKILLNDRIEEALSNFEVKEPVKSKVILVVNLGKRQDPVLIGDFEGHNHTLRIGKSDVSFSKLNFKGHLQSLDTNGIEGNTQTASITFAPVTGKLLSFPFSASVSIHNFDDPRLEVNGKVLVEMDKLDYKVARNFVLQGSVTAKVNYSGQARGLSMNEFLESPRKFRAALRFNNFSYRKINNPHKFVFNGGALLDNHDLSFDSLALNSEMGKGMMKGRAENFMNFILGRRKGFKSQLAIRFEDLDLNPFFKDPEEKDKVKKQEAAKSESLAENQDAHEQNNSILNHFEFNVQLFARKMKIRKVESTYVNADLNYKADRLQIKSLSLSTCEGKIRASAIVDGFSSLRADINASNININKMFTQFENFGQNKIVAENLKGTATIEAKFRSNLDERREIIPGTMLSEVNVRIRDGHLINFEPVQKMSNLLFRNRDFNDVSFSDLNETFSTEGYKMRFSEFEVASSVFDFFVVDGLYDFHGNSTVNVLVPWSNLKRRKKDYVPKKSGDAAIDAKGVKLSFSGPSDKMSLGFGHKPVSGL